MIGYLMLLLLSFLSFLLIVIVLLQRGRGGGLAGALGGAGGQSAFGTKAGDVFTKITVVMAIIWVLLAGFSINILEWTRPQSYPGGAEASPSVTEAPSDDGQGEDTDRPPSSLGPAGEIPTGDEDGGETETPPPGDTPNVPTSQGNGDSPSPETAEPSGENTDGNTEDSSSP